MLIIKSNEVRVIVEIEKSNVKPVQICGKLLASALSSHYVYGKTEPIPMHGSVLFVQVIDASELKLGNRKVQQCKNLERVIQKTPPIKDSRIRDYKLSCGDRNDFGSNGERGKQLVAQLETLLGTARKE
jgi:hypothetical protein